MKKLFAYLFLIHVWGLTEVMAQRKISGIVTDEANMPLVGANVLVEGRETGTITEVDGEYMVEVQSSDSVLIFSYIGYRTQQIAIGPEDILNVVLTEESTSLDKIIVVGFGTSTRRKLTSAVESVNEEVYIGAAKATPLQALQGRMAGVQIIQSSGAVGSAMNVRIRGQTSINASNQPLYVIDGVITDTYTGFPFFGPGSDKMIGLDPNNIASVEVLKDGAAAAIYGARGANGVILITTKQGEFNMRPRVELSYQLGISEATVKPDLMTGPKYAHAWNRAVEAVDGPDNLLYPDPDAVRTTDWWEVFTRTPIFQDVHLSVAGGSVTTNYYLGAGYRSEEDFFITKGMKRYALQAKINQLIGDRWQTGINLNISRTDRSRFLEAGSISSPTWTSTSFPPTEVPFDENGEPILEFNGRGYQFSWNPYVEVTETDLRDALTQVRAGVFVQFSPTPGLILKSEFNPEFSLLQENDFESDRTRLSSNSNGFGYVGTHSDQNYFWTNTASWTFNPASGSELTVLGGSQVQWKSYSLLEGFGSVFPNRQLKDLASAGNSTALSEAEGYRFAGFFTRANYAFNNRLFASASLRYDGSSRFGVKNRWGLFPALSVGWLISEEEFMKNSAFDYLKLSGSVGKTGNAEIGNFDSRSVLIYRFSYQRQPTATIPTRIGNDELTWETTVQYNISASFGLWQERLNGNVSLFIKDTDGLLFFLPVSPSNGVLDIAGNAGSVRNKGVEFQIGSNLKPWPNLHIGLGFNGAFVDNKITALPDTDGDGSNDDILSTGQILRVGESLSTYYLVQYDGVDPENGDALFYDVELDGSSNQYPSGSSRLVKGSAIPLFTGGFNLDLKFKRLFASAAFQTGLGHHIYSYNLFIEDGFQTAFNKNGRQQHSWTPENTDTNIPEARWGETNGSQESTRWLEKGDYLRLKNVQLGYRLTNIGSHSNTLTVYLAGQNLWTLSSAYNIDPEVTRISADQPFGAVNLNTVALSRSISFGIKLEL
ncbi:MAG: SusC/RagA family TonB-linked outer membrane protein [Saprospiraceae bacterium]|nr:SusC/RagA family TonB-linked outer membrane protein [Saprospiraceae bacterium]